MVKPAPGPEPETRTPPVVTALKRLRFQLPDGQPVGFFTTPSSPATPKPNAAVNRCRAGASRMSSRSRHARISSSLVANWQRGVSINSHSHGGATIWHQCVFARSRQCSVCSRCGKMSEAAGPSGTQVNQSSLVKARRFIPEGKLKSFVLYIIPCQYLELTLGRCACKVLRVGIRGSCPATCVCL